jgi:PhnB protein
MSTTTTEVTLELKPYIFFYGRAQEALDFYKSVLGGTYEAMPQEHDAKKVMHAHFSAPGLAFFCSDGRPDDDGKRIDPEEGNISLALNVPDKAAGDRIFAALSQGGTVRQPLADAFWGGRFGSLYDRFGIEWMVTTP